ncbi:hypothetical protein DH2020_021610 [Rehmannia glutinosa]|uniref:Protein kinase domain-containing protein n=1 Tax=Rehmannia glutinosa TaxID=99300 RepID=A0ABR0WF65_REHGL
MASVSSLVPVICSARTTTPRTRKNDSNGISKSVSPNKKQKLSKNGGGLGNIVEVVQKDVAFLKAGFSKGLRWANNAFRIPEVSKSVEYLIWLRNIEDPQASLFRFPSWPQPYYPELSGVDLFLADLKAMEVYVGYFYYLSKMWTKPLPEIYDAEKVTEYFTLRPHVVTLRLLEVFTAFVSTTIKFRISRISSAEDEDAGGNVSDHNFGIVLKETMLNLGPTFIKGTVRAARSNPSFSRAEAMKIIEEELGSPVETFFSYVSEEPVAAASFGQVYKASTHDGFDVAVKVQRPNLRHVVVRDIYILRMGEVHSRFTFICSPKVFQHLSKKRVLTMEWMVGDSPSELISVSSQESNRKLLDLAEDTSSMSHGLDKDVGLHITNASHVFGRSLIPKLKNRIVNKGVEASLVQLLETGLMHADPHPGNLRYLSSGKIGFLDFGLLCRMEKKHQFAMLAFIVHIVNGDWASLVYDLTEMDVVRPGTNIRRFTMDLEDALGELEFDNGMPNVKFSRVLGKIWSVALKYHCRMPPYYILVLRSLASLEGLAEAADPTFKTFEAAYPYVVQKLLVDNSAATRRILHSFTISGCIQQKERISMAKACCFLRIGATRKGLQSLVPLNTQTSLTQSANGVGPMVDLANLALRILPSKNGLVLRRLLMTADGASLVRALVSNEASPFRQQLCKIVADILYRWMCEALEKGLNLSKFSSPVSIANNPQLSATSDEYEYILKDRRLRVIFFKSLNSAKKDPILLLRFFWASFVVFFMASAMACHRVLVSLTGDYLSRLSYNSSKLL